MNYYEVVSMKKYIMIPLAAIMSVQTVTAANIDISVNTKTKKIEAAVDMGRKEKSVATAAKITDSDGSIDYLADGFTDENGKWYFDYTTNKSGNFDVTAYAGGTLVTDTFFIGDTITVEAENYSAKNTGYLTQTMTDDGLSGGKLIAYGAKADSTKNYILKYEFNVQSEGMYALTARTTQLGVRWTTDYTIKINGTEYRPADYAEKIGDFTDYGQDKGLLKEYSLGSFHLNKGKNILMVTLDTDDPTESGDYIFYADCFTFDELGCEFDKITTTDAMGAYEYGTDVVINVDFTSYAYSGGEYTYTYKITDFWNDETSAGTITLEKGEKTIAVDLGQYECGWYKFKLFENGTEISEVNFAVVPPYSERYTGETPFAADLDTAQLVRTNEMRRKFAKSAKLAGIQWVRERTSQNGLYTTDTSKPYYKSVNKIADIMHENDLKVISVLYDFKEETDLAAVYAAQKELSENTSVDMWEIDNETDGSAKKASADEYSAFYKASALGNADSGTDTKISMSSQCMEAYAPYNALFMKNDLMAFSDIYNFHTHTTYADGNTESLNKAITDRHIGAAKDNGDRPFWITEAGIYIQTDENKELSFTQLADQARYNVVSTVQSLAAGTDKHFWFIWPQFIENGKEMGTFDKNFNPNPSYQSQAVMTAKLGKAEIKGKFDFDGAEGYVFDSGNGDVAVIWAENDETLSLAADGDVAITDIMGKESTASANGGSVDVNVGKYPIYVTYANGTAYGYTPVSHNREYKTKTSYSAAERMVIRQSVEGIASSDARTGYMLEKGNTANVELEIYNFNNDEKTVTLNGSLYGYDVIFDEKEITVPAMQSVKTNVQLKPKGTAIEDMRLCLMFSCTADGETSSPSAGYVVVSDTEKQPDILASGYNKASSWSKNISSGGSAMLTETSGGLHFDVTTAASDSWYNKWYYPNLTTKSSETADTDGISFTVCADTDSDNCGVYNIYVYLSDGRSYYLGGNSGIKLSSKTARINRGWEEFVLNSSPLGTSDTRTIDPKLITRISFGGHFYTDNVGYTLKYLGYYKKAESGGITILSGWSGNDIAKAQIVNNCGDIGEYVLAAAVYDESGKLLNVYCGDIGSKTANAEYDANIKGDMRGSTVKLFAWNGLSDITPLTKAEIIKQEEKK